MPSIKTFLIKTVKAPMIAIIKIIQSKDTDRAKLEAISLYCNLILKSVNKTILKENEKSTK